MTIGERTEIYGGAVKPEPSDRRLLSESEGYELLAKRGIPVPDHAVARDANEAVSAAKSIGFPVVMKVVSPQVVHKSDAGGVVVGVRSEQEVIAAFDQIARSVKTRIPEADITGIIVEKMMPPGLELIIGGKTDPSFGKVVTFGLGGELVELIKDVSIRVLPIDANEIQSMMTEIKGYALIK